MTTVAVAAGIGLYVVASYGGMYWLLKKGTGGPAGLAWLAFPAAPLVIPIAIVGWVKGKVTR